MKKILSRIFTTLGFSFIIAGLIFSTFPSHSYAEDLELIGKDIGLVVEPSDTRLFDLNRLNPGDTEEAKIIIKNNYSSPFQLYMRAERMSPPPEEGLGDLFEQLILTVYLKDIEIYSGPMKDYAISNISLGMFNPGDVKKLKAIVHLPGLETGNEFQDATVEVKWLFIAQADKGPDKPDEPDEPDKPDKPDKPWIPPKEPGKPVEPTKPGELLEPEEPIEEIEEDEIPIGEPEVETPSESKEEPQEKEKISKEKPKLPKTGEAPLMFFYITGTLMVLLGIGLESKNKK